MSATSTDVSFEIEVKVPVNKRLEDRLAAQAAGKSLRIVVPGKCKGCGRRSPDVPATKNEAVHWFSTKEVPTTMPKYAARMLTEGLHRECQKAVDDKVKAKAQKRLAAAARKRPVVLDDNAVERAIARRRAARR